MNTQQAIENARAELHEAEAVVVAAGAGIGVDSGLPDFRGTEGFWNAYPPFRELGLRFEELASPEWFECDPALAWGFYGHRLELYRATQPHAGFGWLRTYLEQRPRQGFVFTSNVDGQFQRAGFPEDRIVECHGSIHRLQRIDSPRSAIWSADDTTVCVDGGTMRAVGELPRDSASGVMARPNILMFGDDHWNPTITNEQLGRFKRWLAEVRGARLVIIEIGAGLAVPSVRWQSERLVASHGARLIRINPRDPQVPAGQIALPFGALDGLKRCLAEA